MRILVTGCSGFIGFHVCNKLLQLSEKIFLIGVDNLNNYYDERLKKARLKILKKEKNFIFYKKDISNYNELKKIFTLSKPDIVLNLAAQAGVRYSIKYPQKYFDSNIQGFFNLIDISKNFKIKHFIYASTSSVYGNINKFPITEEMNTDKPLSFYAASKKCNEIIAHSYSFVYRLPTTGLRFFTVYGPYGRPDMALFKFTKNILNNKRINLFNYGKHTRDFTFIDYVTESIVKIIKKFPSQKIPYEIYNIGGSKPVTLINFINILEKNLGKKAKIKYLKLQKGDVKKTHASNAKLIKKINFKSKPLDVKFGIKLFTEWYKNFYDAKIF